MYVHVDAHLDLCRERERFTNAPVVLYWLQGSAAAQWQERGRSTVSSHSNPRSIQQLPWVFAQVSENKVFAMLEYLCKICIKRILVEVSINSQKRIMITAVNKLLTFIRLCFQSTGASLWKDNNMALVWPKDILILFDACCQFGQIMISRMMP